MRILVLSALYPPPVIGGAEVAAWHYTNWLARQGHDVAVLTTARTKEEEIDDEFVDGVRMYRLLWPRIYPIGKFQEQPGWKKPIWHLQDHLDPRNVSMVAKVLDRFRPDFVNIHYLQGIGYNVLAELGRRSLPVLYCVNDLGLGCIRMSMFRHGRQCETQCASCALSSRFKAREVAKVGRIGFWSPSRATLDMLRPVFPIDKYPNTHIVYPNIYARPTVARTASTKLRFVYVGRLHPSKGVDVLLDAAAGLAGEHDFSMTIVGGGQSGAELRAKYGALPFVTFTGHVTEQEVANHLAQSDVACAPSVWAEPLGMVIVHALLLGTPVLGSRVGGIPELIDDGENGLLLPPGDVAAWRDALKRILERPSMVSEWRRYAEAHAWRFDQDRLAREVVSFARSIETGLSEAGAAEERAA